MWGFITAIVIGVDSMDRTVKKEIKKIDRKIGDDRAQIDIIWSDIDEIWTLV